MKIAVCTNCVPFLQGGAEHLAQALVQKLGEHGHQAVLVRVPFRWEPPSKILECMLACRLLRIPNVDRVVALKFPAYYIPHPDKRLWLLHQFRQAYDLWGTEYQGLPDSSEGRAIRDAITRADNLHLRDAGKIYTNSRVTSDRLQRFNGIESEVLWPPLLDDRKFFCAGYEDFVFYPSRIVASKRQHLLVRAMAHVKTPVRAVIAGRPETAGDLEELRKLTCDLRLESRVTLLPQFISEEVKAELFSRALACAYLPYDEDSYGYVTMESFAARKPVVACTDSGGTDVLVRDKITGFMVPAEPARIAEALDTLYADRALARRLGEAGMELTRSMNITWERVTASLTA